MPSGIRRNGSDSLRFKKGLLQSFTSPLSCTGLVFLAFIFAGYSSTACGQASRADNTWTREGTTHGAPAEYVPDELLVRFRSATAKHMMRAAHGKTGANLIKSYRMVEGLQHVKLPAGMTVKQAIQAYREDPEVLYAEPNYIFHIDSLPNDPRFAEQWNMQTPEQTGGPPGGGIDAVRAWDRSAGSKDVVVAVIDTGVDYTHPDLAANMFENQGECSSNGVDDDGNGYVDDCHGINAYDSASTPMDDVGHGTHVAGIIGAVGNNALGVAGVNWKVSILPCKFIGPNGTGPLSDALECFDYVALMKDRGVNIVATNNSWGGTQYSQALHEAIQAQWQRGILCVAGAGNMEGTPDDYLPSYPASYYLPNVISVASTDSYGDTSGFSKSGKYNVHLGAPGEMILSTVPGKGYDLHSGTSMATPHVTGVAALLKAQDPSRDWRTIKNLILAGGDDNGQAWTITGKRLNAYGSMACSNSEVYRRLQPTLDTLTGYAGVPIDLAVLNINCAQPNGEVEVTEYWNNEQIILRDDGTGADQQAGDGIYSARWIPPVGNSYELNFPGSDYVNVGVVGKYIYASTEFNYRTITGTNLNLTGSAATCMTPPFPMTLAGKDFNQLCISGNGTISYTYALTQSVNEPIPTPLASTLIAPFWDSLYPVADSDQNVFWEVSGDAPNRELVIEWRNVRHYDCRNDSAATVKFQIVLFEYANRILFNYADTSFGGACAFADHGAAATVGVQFAANFGTQFSFETPSLGDNSALDWHLPSVAFLKYVDLSM